MNDYPWPAPLEDAGPDPAATDSVQGVVGDKPVIIVGGKPVLVGDKPAMPHERGLHVTVALQRLAEELAQRRELVARLVGDTGRALLLRIPDTRHLHVVGDSPLAGRCRELLTGGHVDTWDLEPVASSRRLLSTLQASTATRGALERAGFATLEELEVSPDVCLRQLRNMGTIRLQELRAQVPYCRRGGEPASDTVRRAPAAAPGGDPLGAAMRRCWDAGAAAGLEAIVVERDDAYLTVCDVAGSLGVGPGNDLENTGLEWTRGRVLDVGCGAGRLALELVARGHSVRGIDTSPGAIGIAQSRGLVADCACYLDPQPGPPVDTVVMLGGGAELLAAAPRLEEALSRLVELVVPNGRLVIDGINPYASADPDQLDYLDRARRAGRPGRLRVRLRDRAVATDWFERAVLAAHEVIRTATTTGAWTLEHEAHGTDGRWLLVLQTVS